MDEKYFCEKLLNWWYGLSDIRNYCSLWCDTRFFRYKDQDTKNYASENQDIMEKMDEYAKSNMQSFQYIKDNGGL